MSDPANPQILEFELYTMPELAKVTVLLAHLTTIDFDQIHTVRRLIEGNPFYKGMATIPMINALHRAVREATALLAPELLPLCTIGEGDVIRPYSD